MYNVTTCHTCWSAIPGCVDCIKPSKCRLCADGYEINRLTRMCDVNGDGHTVLIIILCAVVVVIVVGGIVAWRMVKRRTRGEEGRKDDDDVE